MFAKMFTKTPPAVFAALFLAACAVTATSIDFGDNSSALANDGECDDPRFAGPGMAPSFADVNIQRDAEDCRRLYNAAEVRLAQTQVEFDIAQCNSIDYGNDASQWARDGRCDDPRFTGPGVDNILNDDDIGTDATDCRSLCTSGRVWLR